MGVKDVRDRAKREREFYGRSNLQQCVVCGRLFCKRKDRVCSIACDEKAKAKACEERE
jgi:hypothetical protein